MQITLPTKTLKPELVKISMKDHELTIQDEYNSKSQNRYEWLFFRKTITLPSATQVDQLESHMANDGQLSI